MPPRAPLVLAAIAFAGCSASTAQAKGPSRPLNPLASLNRSFRTLSDRVAPAVVQVLSTRYAPVPAGGGHVLAKRRSTGSGVVISGRGHILTNAHVVQGAHFVQVRLPRQPLEKGRSIVKPEGEVRRAKILGIDGETDLALLEVDSEGLTVAELGSSDELTPGELVLAFGAPFGLEGSVTMGVVSAVARQRHPDDSMVFIQTDAPINPGNSGGPLVNAQGQVVGINTFIVSPSGASSGLGFAVPSNIAKTVYEQLRTMGRVQRGIIGASTQSITPLMAEGLGLDRTHGVIVADVHPRGPAKEAGLQIGDVVLSLEGKPMENARQFDVNVYHQPVGEAVEVQVLRDGEVHLLKIQVVERPAALSSMRTRVDPNDNLVSRLGILAIDLSPTVRKMLPRLRVPTGVLVVATGPGEGSAALDSGDVVYTVNGTEVDGLDRLRAMLEGLAPGDPIVLQVERRGRLRFVPLFAE